MRGALFPGTRSHDACGTAGRSPVRTRRLNHKTRHRAHRQHSLQCSLVAAVLLAVYAAIRELCKERAGRSLVYLLAYTFLNIKVPQIGNFAITSAMDAHSALTAIARRFGFLAERCVMAKNPNRRVFHVCRWFRFLVDSRPLARNRNQRVSQPLVPIPNLQALNDQKSEPART